MNRLHVNALLTLLTAAIGLALLVNADQPVSQEAALVQRWYDALCAGDVWTAAALTWPGALDAAALRHTLRSGVGPCSAQVDRGMIGFEALPSELTGTVERIKFVAVNVGPAGTVPGRNHILSIQTGVHVIFFRSGEVKVWADWLGQPLTGVIPHGDSIPLTNNDGLLMGHARADGAPVAGNDLGLVGVPVRLMPERAWGAYELRLFTGAVLAEGLSSADSLPEAERAAFIPTVGENLPGGTARSGVAWFRLPAGAFDLESARLWLEVRQTPWDFRALGSFAALAGGE